MPRRLRPTAPIAARALLVGDPGRALLLAQELLEAPKMSNHARGLWGYGGRAADGDALTIQSTGMGGPSAAIVLADLAELGVRAAIRVGTCVAIDPGLALGDLLAVSEAEEKGAPAADRGAVALPNPELTAGLVRELAGGQAGECRGAKIASLQAPLWVAPDISGKPTAEAFGGGVVAADMQTATVLAPPRRWESPRRRSWSSRRRPPASRSATSRWRRPRSEPVGPPPRPSPGSTLGVPDPKGARVEARGLTLSLRFRLRSRLRPWLRLSERAAQVAYLLAQPVDLLLDLLQPRREGAQAPLQPFDVACRGQVEGAHRRLLSLQRLLPRPEGGGQRRVQSLAVGQGLGDFADRLLSPRPQALLILAIDVHTQEVNRPVRTA